MKMSQEEEDDESEDQLLIHVPDEVGKKKITIKNKKKKEEMKTKKKNQQDHTTLLPGSTSSSLRTKPTTGKKRGRPPKIRPPEGHTTSSPLLKKKKVMMMKGKKGESPRVNKNNILGKVKKDRKDKVQKDPNAPHRPSNPFMLYLRENRPSMKLKHPEAPVPEVTKLLALEWVKLTEQEKKPYVERAGVLRSKYMKDISAYRASDAFKKFKKGLLVVKKYKKVNKMKKDTENQISPSHKKKRGRPKKLKTPSSFDEDFNPFKKLMTSKGRIPLQSKKVDTSSSLVNQTTGNVKIFTDEFLEHNKDRESELRKLRKLTTDLEEQNAILSKHIDNLKAAEMKLRSEMAVMTEQNEVTERHWNRLKAQFVHAFSGIPIPGSREYPRLETVEDYLDKLQKRLTTVGKTGDSPTLDGEPIRNQINSFLSEFAALDS